MKKLRKRKFILLILVGLILLSAFYIFFDFPQGFKTIEIRGQKFKAEVADSQEKREKGLSGREKLCQECAMMFIFPFEGRHAFWMKEMRFGLDIAWIRENKIVDVAKNVAPDDPSTVSPKEPADIVLELNEGILEKYGIKKGDQVTFFQ